MGKYLDLVRQVEESSNSANSGENVSNEVNPNNRREGYELNEISPANSRSGKDAMKAGRYEINELNELSPTCMFCRKPVQRGTPGTGALAGKDLHMDCYIRSEKQEEGKSLLVEVPPLPEPTRCKEWDASTHDIIDWFLKTVPPTEPFELSQGVTIADPALWWATIRGDIAAGPKGPRAHYGALQGDLRRLAGLLQPDIIEREERAAIKAEGACPNDVIDPLKKELNDLPHENPKNKSPPWD